MTDVATTLYRGCVVLMLSAMMVLQAETVPESIPDSTAQAVFYITFIAIVFVVLSFIWPGIRAVYVDPDGKENGVDTDV